MTLTAAPATRSSAPGRRPGIVSHRRNRVARSAWEIAAITAIWGTSLVIAVLWVAGGGIQAIFAGGADLLNSLGRLTGLVSANLLLYQVLLMARMPLFERGLGRDTITRLHRSTGFWSFWLLMVHIVLLMFGYAAQAGVNPLAQLWDFVWNYPGMMLATAGTLLLVLVVVTSIRRARRRLRYESWHLIHLYGYLGVGLAIPHMLWTGSDFVGATAASAYWWGLWAVTAASVVLWRIVVPLVRSARLGLRVASVHPDGRRGVEVTMTGRGLRRLRTRPGQFFVWRFLDGPGWTRGHPFSLAAAPTGDTLTIAAAFAGDGTRRMASMAVGTRVMIEGPYGTMTGQARTGTRMLMIGAGAGVAPLVSILEGEAFAPGEAMILTRDHDRADAMRSAAIGKLQVERGLVHVALDGPRARTSAGGPVSAAAAHAGSSWLPATHAAWDGVDLLRHLYGDLRDCDVYVCGPQKWMAAVCRDLKTAGVAPTRLHTESFTV